MHLTYAGTSLSAQIRSYLLRSGSGHPITCGNVLVPVLAKSIHFLAGPSPSRLRRSRRAALSARISDSVARYAYNFRRLRGQTFPASNRRQLLQTRGADRGRTFPQVIARRHPSSPKIRASRVCERFPRPYARDRKLAKRLRSSLPTRFPRIHRSSSMADLGEQVRQSYL